MTADTEPTRYLGYPITATPAGFQVTSPDGEDHASCTQMRLVRRWVRSHRKAQRRKAEIVAKVQRSRAELGPRLGIAPAVSVPGDFYGAHAKIRQSKAGGGRNHPTRDVGSHGGSVY